MNLSRFIFKGLQILQENEWLHDDALVVEKGRIKAIIREDEISAHLPATILNFPKNYFLSPGLIDLHIHGANACDVMDGQETSIIKISQALAKEGVTGFLATTMTAENAKLEKVLKTLCACKKKSLKAALLGIHLEGPFIAKDKMGAQKGDLTQLPNPQLIEDWQKKAGGLIKLITLAPELNGSIELIKQLKSMGIIVSIGHTNATYEETADAICAGATQATHLFNAMRGIHHREPGALTSLLLEDIDVELILDGWHLHPAIAKLVLKVKGKNKILLVTDAMRAKCLKNGDYELGGQTVRVHNGKVTLSNGTLAGSTLTMPEAILNMQIFSGCTLIEAINMASLNPARALGLDTKKGSLSVGKDADLVVFNENFKAELTMREGEIIYQKETISTI